MSIGAPPSRILRRPSIQLIEKDGYVVLGPDFAVTVRNLTALAFAVEAVAFPGLVLTAGLWWFYCSYTLAMLVILVVVYGVMQTAFAVGLVVYLHRKMKKHTRFTQHPEGDITVKDRKYKDIFLEHRPEMTFVRLAGADGKGREIFDLMLEHGGKTYYLLSGYEGDEMQKLCEDLSKACGP